MHVTWQPPPPRYNAVIFLAPSGPVITCCVLSRTCSSHPYSLDMNRQAPAAARKGAGRGSSAAAEKRSRNSTCAAQQHSLVRSEEWDPDTVEPRGRAGAGLRMGRILDRAPPHSDLATIYPSTPPSFPGGAVTWRGHSMSAFLRWDHKKKSAFRSLPRARAAVESRWSHRNGLLGAAQALCLLVVAVIAALVVASLRAAPPKRAHSAATLYRRMGSGVSLSTLPLRSRMDGRMDGRMGWTPPDPFRKHVLLYRQAMRTALRLVPRLGLNHVRRSSSAPALPSQLLLAQRLRLPRCARRPR